MSVQIEDMPKTMSPDQQTKIILANKSDREKWKKDTHSITASRVEKSNLFLTLTYSGGCKEHKFELVAWNYFVIKPNEIQADILLSHDSNSDFCKSIVKTELCFDLSPLESEYQKFFQSASGTIALLLNNLKLRYEF
jgi:hypothetical protein